MPLFILSVSYTPSFPCLLSVPSFLFCLLHLHVSFRLFLFRCIFPAFYLCVSFPSSASIFSFPSIQFVPLYSLTILRRNINLDTKSMFLCLRTCIDDFFIYSSICFSFQSYSFPSLSYNPALFLFSSSFSPSCIFPMSITRHHTRPHLDALTT